MMSICRKELRRFFSSLTGYITIILFLLVSGLFLFVLPDSNIPDNSYATLDKFFELAPWIFLFLVPALTMHSFSDEFRQGTFELLRTKPVSTWQITLGKYLAILVVIIIVLLPTLIYVYTIKSLSQSGLIDSGGISGSYIGLFFLAAAFAAVCLCCSAFTSNTVVAFLAGGFVCLLLYFGFNAVSRIPFFAGSADYYIENAGIDFHYKSMSRGVVDTRDMIYFLSIIFLSLFITVKNISKKQ